MLMAAAPICCRQFHGRSCEERRGAMFRSVRGEGESRNQCEKKEKGAREFSRKDSGGSRPPGCWWRGGGVNSAIMKCTYTHHFTFSSLIKNVISAIFFSFFFLFLKS